MASRDEKNVLDIIEKVSKSVVNISTIKLVHNMFYRAVTVAGMDQALLLTQKDSYSLTTM
jgi:hypothetical protein